MKDWLKKLFGLFDEEAERAEEVKPFRQTSSKVPEHPRSETRARISYQYPSGNFRFPVLPDQNHAPKRTTIKKAREQKQNKEIYENNSQATRSKKFEPTDVPSPIHGFHPPFNRQVTATDELVSEEDSDFKLDIGATQIVMDEYGEERSDDQEEMYEGRIPAKEYHDDPGIEPKYKQESESSPHELEGQRLFYDQLERDVQQQDENLLGENKADQANPPFTTDLTVGYSNNPSNSDAIGDSTYSVPQKKAPFDNEEQQEKKGYFDNELVQDKDRYFNNDIEQERQLNGEQPEVSDRGGEALNDRPKETSNVSKEEKKRHDKQPPKTPTNANGSHIPYNVWMLKRDKQSVEHKQANKLSTKPPVELLGRNTEKEGNNDEWLVEQRELLSTTLTNFNVKAKVINAVQGPSVTRLEVQPEPGVKVNKITNLIDDIKLSLAAKDIRIEAPIPGRNAIGIEVPNKKAKPVFIGDIIRERQFQESASPLTVSLGLDISGTPIVTDLKKMPHGLIAGATGSGKSVCINSIIVSLLYKAEPSEVKLMLIDPKMVELAPYNEIPHLVCPVIHDVKAANAALKWAVSEMERRYELFAHTGVRDIERFNQKASGEKPERLPYLVIIIDELADLMMVSPQEVEEAICRIAQKARACGIHLLLATQRPSVDVITGLIKANIPARIAFSVSSQIDSRTIIDHNGAEKLLGKGDMLFLENGSPKPVRIQGCFVSDEEIERTANDVKQKAKPQYLFEQEQLIDYHQFTQDEDDLFEEACEFVFDQEGASASSLQRRFHIGYNRAARLIDMMEVQGIISEQRGSKPREVFMSKESFASMRSSL